MLAFSSQPNVAMLVRVARRLGPLLPETAFVGGATVALYITRRGLPPIRPTDDVDIIVEVASLVTYHAFTQKLRTLGFREDVDSKVLCRWRVEEETVDVMPTQTSILGFSNRWYQAALQTAQDFELQPDLVIRLVTAPYFLGTKCEAFLGRGCGDFLLSHDMDDIITVLQGRPAIVEEVAQAAPALKSYLAAQFTTWLGDPDFRDALSGHLNPDAVSQASLPWVLQRIQDIAAL